jgi:hypothetical protein
VDAKGSLVVTAEVDDHVYAKVRTNTTFSTFSSVLLCTAHTSSLARCTQTKFTGARRVIH